MVDTRLFHPDNGCLLQVLFGLHLLGRPARKRELGEMYGLCDEAIQNAIEKLADPACGLVVAIPSGRWPRYQLSEAGQQLLLPLATAGLPRPAERLTSPEVSPVPTGVTLDESGLNRDQITSPNLDSGSDRTQMGALPVARETDSGLNRDQVTPQPAKSDADSGLNRTQSATSATPLQANSGSSRNQLPEIEKLTPVSAGVTENDSGFGRNQRAEGNGLLAFAQNQNQLINLINSSVTEELSNLYAQALRAGGVFPNIRRQLVPQLTAAGPAFLPHLLGHIAFANSGECEQRPGVYVNDVARHRELCPAAWLPDLTLTFDEALALALEGQTHLPPPASVVATAVPETGWEAPPPPLTAAEAHWAQVWETALRQLRMEMPHHTFDLWLRDTHLQDVQAQQAVVVVPTTFARDWLTNQLQGAVNRVLTQLLGQGVEVQFVVAPAHPQAPAER